MTSTQRWTTGPADGADRLAVRSGRPHDHLLRDHLLREHGRTAGELDGLPVAYLHHFEHVEQAMGLTELGHRHADRGQPGSIDPVSR